MNFVGNGLSSIVRRICLAMGFVCFPIYRGQFYQSIGADWISTNQHWQTGIDHLGIQQNILITLTDHNRDITKIWIYLEYHKLNYNKDCQGIWIIDNWRWNFLPSDGFLLFWLIAGMFSVNHLELTGFYWLFFVYICKLNYLELWTVFK